MTDTERSYMLRAVELARQGGGNVNPNPRVGAVIVKDGRVIGEGYHQKFGQLHAERNALASCIEDPAGATIYVTLEPCCHYGKTPPCTEAIIEKKLARVVVGSRDPNPKVNGGGVRVLREAGIRVDTDFCREECDALNPYFFKFIGQGRPYVTLKFAETLDGKIASVSGKSQWISGEASRRHTHMMRSENMAIMVGSGTVLADNPMLTCRVDGGMSPVRVICDSRLRTPVTANVITTAAETGERLRQPRTVIATCVSDEERLAPYRDAGAAVLVLPEGNDGHLNLPALMEQLGAMNIDSVICEGGGQLNWSALKSGIVDRVQAYVAPKLFGGSAAPGPVGGTGVDAPAQAWTLHNIHVTPIGTDFLLEGDVETCSQE